MATYYTGTITDPEVGGSTVLNIADMKLLWLYGSLQTGFGFFQAESHFMIGFARAVPTGPSAPAVQNCHVFQSRWEGLFGAQTSNRGRTANKLGFAGAGIGYSSQIFSDLAVSAVTATTVTITFGALFLGAPFKLQYFAIGGTDVTVTSGTDTCPTSTTTQAISHGLGTTPNAVICTSGWTGNNTNGSFHSFGFADGTRQAVTAIHEAGQSAIGVNPNDNDVYQRTNKVIAMLDDPGGSVIAEAAYQSHDSTQFVLNWTTAPAAGQAFEWIAIAGIAAYVGSFDQGDTSVATTGVRPLAVMAQSFGNVAGTSVVDGLRYSLGISAGVLQAGAWIGDNDGITSTGNERAVRYQSNTATLIAAHPTGTSSGATDALGSIGSFAGGSFGITWASDDAVARQWVFLAFGSPYTSSSIFTLPNAWRGIEGPIYYTIMRHRDEFGVTKDFTFAPIALGDPDNFYAGYKEERLLAAGDISCPRSDRSGRIQIPSARVRYSDVPALRTGRMPFRGMLGNPNQLALHGAEITLYCTTERQRRALADPVIVFRGFVFDYQTPADYLFDLEARGWLARRLAEPLWPETIADLFSQAPAANLKQSLPMVCGKLSDEGSDTAAPVFVDDESGRGGAGEASAAPGPPSSSWGTIGVAAPTGFAAVELPGAGSINITGGVLPGNHVVVFARRVVAGVEGDPNYFLPADQIANAVTINADGAAVQCTCDNDGADAYRFYACWDYFGARVKQCIETTDPVTGVIFDVMPPLGFDLPVSAAANVPVGEPNGWLTCVAVMPNGRTTQSVALFAASNGGQMRPSRAVVAPIVGALEYEFYLQWGGAIYQFVVPPTQVNLDGNIYLEWSWNPAAMTSIASIPAPAGVVPPIHCGKFTDLLGFPDWDGFLVSCRDSENLLYYAGYLTLETTTNGVTTRTITRIADSLYVGSGAQIAAPGIGDHDTFFGAPPYTTTAGYTPYMVFLRGALRDRALGLNGYTQEDLRFNVSQPVTSIYEKWRDINKNLIVADSPSIKNPFNQNPVFSDGLARFDDAFLDAAVVDALAVIPGGPECGRWLPGSMTVEQFFQDICPSAVMHYGIKPAGGAVVTSVDNPAGDPHFEIDELTEVIDGSYGMKATTQGFANATPYTHTPIYDRTAGISSSTEAAPIEHATSQGPVQGYNKRKKDDTIPFTWRRSAGLAQQCARAFNAQSAYLPQMVDAASVLHWVHRAPGERAAITHRQGADATGIVLRKHAVCGLTLSLDLLKIGMTALDLRRNVGDLSAFLEEAFMRSMWIGGSKHDTCLAGTAAPINGMDVPAEWQKFTIDWDEIPGTHGINAVIQIRRDAGAGSATPAIFLYGEDPVVGLDSPVVSGSAHSSSSWAEQVLLIPRLTGQVDYWMLPILSGGAVANDFMMFGQLLGFRI